jgi:ssDNA thymidine ADP-ribosyltransferase, DarT
MSPTIRNLFHFTDQRNLPSIKQNGGLFSYARLKEMGIEIPAPGGNDWSHQADAYKGLDRYVHLCFRPTHPMEHVARVAGRITSSIFLSIHTEVLRIAGVRFTGGVSNKADVETHSIEDANTMRIIDFDMLYGGWNWKDWSDPEIQARLQQVEKYEILVPDHVPFSLILNFPNG